MERHGPTTHDDASCDQERFERRQVARDRDLNTPDTLVIDEPRARSVVRGLIEAETVSPVPEDQILVHVPSGQVFKSDKALAYYHKGWIAKKEDE